MDSGRFRVNESALAKLASASRSNGDDAEAGNSPSPLVVNVIVLIRLRALLADTSTSPVEFRLSVRTSTGMVEDDPDEAGRTMLWRALLDTVLRRFALLDKAGEVVLRDIPPGDAEDARPARLAEDGNCAWVGLVSPISPVVEWIELILLTTETPTPAAGRAILYPGLPFEAGLSRLRFGARLPCTSGVWWSAAALCVSSRLRWLKESRTSSRSRMVDEVDDGRPRSRFASVGATSAAFDRLYI